MSNNTIQEADKKEHKVEDQWHYKPLIEHGFEPIDKVKTGLVRSYDYEDKYGNYITCSTGYSADHWGDKKQNTAGYWGSLASHLKNYYPVTQPFIKFSV